jgi:hypothetical protein
MGNYISLKKNNAKKINPNSFYQSLHKYDKFYSDVKLYKTPIPVKY